MTYQNTSSIIEKLEAIVDFRVGENAHSKCPIVLKEGVCPATDGTQIFLPRKEEHFKSPRDNELGLGNFAAHEADHIREIEEYFGIETAELRAKNLALVQEYLKRNYSALEENPALANEIDNIVKDRRIDAQRKEQLPGVKKFFEETMIPVVSYLRPSVKEMGELDAFREQYLQRALLGKTLEPVSEKYRRLLEEVIAITLSSNSIQEDKETVTRIYELFKKNFDIRKKISQLPPMFGSGSHSETSSGSKGAKTQGEQGYGKEIKPREGRNSNDKRPSKLNPSKYPAPEENSGDSLENKPKKGKKNPENENSSENYSESEDRENPYKAIQDKSGIEIFVFNPEFEPELVESVRKMENKYAGEIESMKRIFRQLQLKHYGEKRDFEGQELDYQDYLQGELEARVTRIKGNARAFRLEARNQQRPTFGIHADTSSSTRGRIIEGIRAAFYIIGNALSASDWNYGLYFSANKLGIIKDPTKKWEDSINPKILGLTAGGNGIYLETTSKAIAADLKRTNGNPRGLIVISDFEVCGDFKKEKAIAKKLREEKIYPFYIAIGAEHEDNVRELTEEIGAEHYSVIALDQLHELPNEIFRLFKTFGIAK